MSVDKYTSKKVPISYKKLGGGLNTTSGPLNLAENESSDLQNIDFDKFGSILKRNGYTALNTSAITNTPNSDGLYWYEYGSGPTRKAINVADGKLWKMDGLDGTWDDVTGGLTITADNLCDFDTFLDVCRVTNNTDPPFEWNGTGNGSASTVPTGLTDAKFVEHYENYGFYANVTVSGTVHPSRFYWSAIKDITSWDAADFIDVAKNDGQHITGFKVMGDRLVVYKTRSIYIVLFTGDRDIPFIVQKTASAIGCVAPYSVQNVENGHVMLAYDGIYFFDGNNSLKISDRINSKILGLNNTGFPKATSCSYLSKTRYMLSVPASGSSTNDTIIVWDWSLNAFSIYDGIDANTMAIFLVSGVEERPYFGDNVGFIYRLDTGADDYPLNVQTAINAYYATNWKLFDNLVDQKGAPHIYIYYQYASSVVVLSYSYNFEDADTYSQNMDFSTSGAVYGSAIFGTDVYGAEGGSVMRRDITGRGRSVRFKFSNATIGETFQIDGLGIEAELETNY